MKGIFKRISFFEEWAGFIKQNYAHIFFIALFYSLEICSVYIEKYDLSLHGFPGRMIGIATLDGIDIARRASLFYKAVCLFLLINAAFYLVAFLVGRKNRNILRELSILNISALAGCLLIFLKVFKLNSIDGIYLVMLIHIIAIIFLLIKQFLLNELHKKLFNAALFSIVLCLGVSFFFLFKECTSFLGISSKNSFYIFLLIFSSLAFLFTAVCVRRLDYSRALVALIRLFRMLIPVMLLPLFSMLKDEVYLILNNKGVLYFTPVRLYSILIFITAIWVYLWNRKGRGERKLLSTYSMLAKYYFPLLILGVTTYIYYSPFITIQSNEMFEEANRFLPIMEFLKYHTVPLLEKFNSHMLYEIFTIYLYAILNNLNGLAPLIYDFIFPVIGTLMVYFIIRDFTRNPYVALFIVLLYPLANDLTVAFFPALLAVYVLYRVIYFPPSVKNYLLLFCSCIFFVVWKIDIGVASVCSIIGVLILYSLVRKARPGYRSLLIALGYVFATILVIYFAFLACGINLISNLLNEYSYLSSSQSYGYDTLSSAPPDKVFQMQYFIFPVTMLLLGAYILFHFKKLTSSGALKFLSLCILFCIGFYIANFERALVRHSFAESTDADISPFVFFVLSGSAYLLCRKQPQIIRFLVFFFSSFLLITGFKYPQCNPSVVYESFTSRLNSFSEIRPQPNISREIDSVAPQNNRIEFQKFISQELKSDETFIDFSNEPMLYYYTQKITPSYFYQGPLSMHNDYLQQRFIENLSNYKVPLLLYSNFPFSDDRLGFNTIDGVPNALRHYRIAEYLFQQYEPFVILQNYCLWKKKSSGLKNNIVPLFIFKKDLQSTTFADSTLKWQPIDSLTAKSEGTFFIILSYRRSSVQRYDLIYRRRKDTNMHKIEPLFLDDSACKIYYAMEHGAGENMKFYLNSMKDVSALEIEEVKYVPDFYSGLPRHWKIGMLPYIWANYDKKIQSTQVEKVISDRDMVMNGSAITYGLPDNIDKSTGNYIYVSLDVVNENPINIRLTYGPSSGSFDFTIPPGEGTRAFAIRVSSQYNWYGKDNRTISFYAPSASAIHFKKVILLKGD